MLTAQPLLANGEDFWLPDFFSEGAVSPLAKVIRTKKKWGFINTAGEFVIKPQFDHVEDFDKGETMVQLGNKVHIINKAGKIIDTPPSRGHVVMRRREIGWKKDAQEREEIEKKLYQGDIWNADGTKYIGTSNQMRISQFSEGLARCAISQELISKFDGETGYQKKLDETPDQEERKTNLVGYINKQGRMVIPPRFHDAWEFHNGVAYVEHWRPKFQMDPTIEGYIDKSGNILGGQYFKNATRDWYEGFATVRKETPGKALNDCGFVDTKGKTIFGGWQDTTYFSNGIAGVQTREGKWGFINRNGEIIVTPQYQHVGYEFKDGLLYVKTGGKYGFINNKGKMVIPAQFADTDSFCEGLAAAAIDVSENEKLEMLSISQDFRCGFLDEKGKVIIPAKFCGARRFSEGLAPVQDGLYWGYIDKQGKTVIDPQFDNALPFQEGLAAVLKDDKWGFIDNTGKYVFDPRIPARRLGSNPVEIVPRPLSFSEGIALVSGPDRQWFFIDKTGNHSFEMPTALSSAIEPSCSSFSEGLAAMANEDITGKYGYINKTGKYVIPPKLEKAAPFSEGLAAVDVVFDEKLAGKITDIEHYQRPKWRHDEPSAKTGFIDKSGKFIVHAKYTECKSFKEGMAAVSIGGTVQNYSDCPEYSIVTSKTPFNQSYAGKWGFVDRTGQEVIKLQYDDARDFCEGLAAVRVGKEWGFIDKHGDMKIKPKYELAGDFSGGLALVKKDGKFGFINETNEIVIAPEFTLCDSFYNGRALFIKPGKPDAIASTKQFKCTPIKTDIDMINFLMSDSNGISGSWWSGRE